MAVSCPEVMYGAYYPYLYGRGAARSFHHAPHFQYDRLNVQSAGNAGEYGGSVAGGGAGGGAPALSSGSASSGAQSPGSPPHAHTLPLPQHVHAHAHAHAHLTHAHSHPSQHHSPRLRTKEEDLSAHGRASADGGGSSESEGECGGVARARAQYVSANCVVFTHYSGDVAAVVDDHFTRALSLDKPKEAVPMASRNLPASFFNAAAAGPACAGLELYDYDPWHQHYAGYGHAHRHAAEYHAAAAHHNMAAAGYGGLLLGRGSLHAQYKPVDWPHAHAHAAHHAHAHHSSPHLDPSACSPYSYPAPPGLEAQVQDTSKDLYWF